MYRSYIEFWSSSITSHCHHQIVYCSLNLSIKFSTSYGRLICDYNKAATEIIAIPIEQVYWENNQQIAISNKTVINVFSNFVSNRLVICDDTKSPWINEFV